MSISTCCRLKIKKLSQWLATGNLQTPNSIFNVITSLVNRLLLISIIIKFLIKEHKIDLKGLKTTFKTHVYYCRIDSNDYLRKISITSTKMYILCIFDLNHHETTQVTEFVIQLRTNSELSVYSMAHKKFIIIKKVSVTKSSLNKVTNRLICETCA